MCHACGCDRYVGRGKRVVLDRAVEIVKVGLTAQNVDGYENTELICDFIAPFGSQEDEVCQTVVWEADLHLSMPRLPGYFLALASAGRPKAYRHRLSPI